MQAKEHGEELAKAQQLNQELKYANKKIAAEVDLAQGAARQATERDRRQLRTLREGLSDVSLHHKLWLTNVPTCTACGPA